MKNKMKRLYQNGYSKKNKRLFKIKFKKVYNPKTIKQLAGEKIKLDDKKPAEKMINPYYFIDESLKMVFKINLESHNITHANSFLTITRNFSEFGIEFRYNIRIRKKLSAFYAIIINQYKFKSHTFFSESFYEIDEKDQRNNQIEFFMNLKINRNLTESDIDIIDVRSQLEHQTKIQETKESGWIFDKIKSMTIPFYKIGELNGSIFVKFP